MVVLCYAASVLFVSVRSFMFLCACCVLYFAVLLLVALLYYFCSIMLVLFVFN